MYKALLLDLDGTTVEPDRGALPSQRVIDAVKKAQKHVHVAAATGRPKNLSQPVIDALGLKGASIFNGGAEIIDVTTGKELHRQALSVPAIKEVVKIVLPFGVSVYRDDDQYDIAMTDPKHVTKDAGKLFIASVKSSEAIHILEALTAVEGVMAHPTTSWEKGDVVDIHITHEHATKRYGAEKLIELMGFKKEEIIAIGDGHNDLPLLEAAGLKIAMGNAPKEVQAQADYIAPPLQDDGVAEVIERYILK